MEFGILSLLPIVLALILAFVTRDALLSLLAGVIVGVCMLFGQDVLWNAKDPFRGLACVFQEALGNADFIWVLCIEVFIGILVAYFQKSGAIKAFSDKIEGLHLGRKGTESLAFGLGMFIFFSDYFSPLYVGNVMRPLTDKAKASREFLAYVCDSTSAPICCLIPFTSWGIYVAGVIAGYGAIADSAAGQAAVIGAFKYNFYCIAALALCGFLGCGIIPHYGPMRKAEKRAMETGAVYAEGSTPLLSGELDAIKPNEDCKPSLLLDFIMPAIIIIGITVGTYAVIGSARTLEAFIAAVMYQFVVMLLRKSATLKQLMAVAVEGIKAVMSAILILAMAYSINWITKKLGTAAYLVSVCEKWMTPFWLLTITFLLCTVMSFLSGSSWGTYAIVLPIVLPLAFAITGGEMGTVVYAAIAAVMGGGCFGDHCSPISDTTILSSLAAGSDHVDHVKTQIPYAATAAVIALIGYMIIGATL
ncbi:MAG: transporter [Clostridia bacterium]|nr:transporter [Clostridia bacterium]